MIANASLQPLLRVADLRVELERGDDIVSDINFALEPGEIVGIVGESGSGKTTIAAALLGHVRLGARVASGTIGLGECANILALSRAGLAAVRGRVVSYVSQDPAMGLNPALRIGEQLAEVLVVHEPTLTRAGRNLRLQLALSEVDLPSDPEFLLRFSHQLSGGQQQRVLLALAFLTGPKLIVLDEPTTALDVTTQSKILETIRELCRKRGAAAVYISHDLALVRNLVDRVIVLYAGRIAEVAPCKTLFTTPRHPYTRGLLDATPHAVRAKNLRPIAGEPAAPGSRPAGCAFGPRCHRVTSECKSGLVPLKRIDASHHVACLHPFTQSEDYVQHQAETDVDVHHTNSSPLLSARSLKAAYADRQVLIDVDVEVFRGECLALVGESGCGKTTLARTLVGLGEQVSGELEFNRTVLPPRVHDRDAKTRSAIQYVFQNPYRALNPTQSVGQILTTTIRHFFDVTKQEADERALAALERVALRRNCLNLYPRELSGGERQRIAIARALVCEPEVLICDEITSALDVSIQATILKLLRSLQEDGLAILFVTHDLGVVHSIADRVVVLQHGRVVETGSVSAVLTAPNHPYTRELLRNSPALSRAHELAAPN